MPTAYVEIKRGANEPTSGTLRRFTKKVQESGIIPKKRSQRYAARTLSPLKVKKAKLLKIGRTKTYNHLKKLGKLTPPKKKAGR
jgi:ribosomal protein S21